MNAESGPCPAICEIEASLTYHRCHGWQTSGPQPARDAGGAVGRAERHPGGGAPASEPARRQRPAGAAPRPPPPHPPPSPRPPAPRAPRPHSLEQVRPAVSDHANFDPARAQLTLTIACTDYLQAVVV